MIVGLASKLKKSKVLQLVQALAEGQGNPVRSFSQKLFVSKAQEHVWQREACKAVEAAQGLKHSFRYADPGLKFLRQYSRLPPWESSMRATGSRLGAWGSQRRRFLPDLSPDAALYGLIGANVAGFCLWQINPRLMLNHFMTSYDHVRQGRVYTLLTACFSQRDFGHLFSNMLGLYFFGRAVAYTIGGSGLVALYLAGGAFGSLVYVAEGWLQTRRMQEQGFRIIRAKQTPALGASGAVNAVVIFDVLLRPFTTVMIFPLPIPLPAWVLGILWIGNDISGALGGGRANVGYTVHLGGAAVGALACYAVRRGRLRRPW